MIRYEKIFNSKTLNIFTDASTCNNKKETIGAPGYIAVIGNEIIKKDAIVLRDSTNNESEIYAILMAIQFALLYKDKVQVINIFSDSQFAVFGLREWIFKWVNNIKDDRLYNSSGNMVANQKIFMNIIYTILEYNLVVNLYHNRGHFTKTRIKEFIYLFTKHNFLADHIDYKTANSIIYYNDVVDNYTRDLLRKNPFQNKLEIIDYAATNEIDMKQYMKLLNII